MRLIDTDNVWGIGILQDWYIHSVNPDDIPQWTDEHIKELCKDFYVIPKETTKYNIDCNLDRLKELIEADKDNRCLILPVKIGDILYYPYNGYISQLQVKYITICSKNTCIIYTEIIDGLNNIETNFNSKWIGETIFLTKEEAQKEADRRNAKEEI